VRQTNEPPVKQDRHVTRSETYSEDLQAAGDCLTRRLADETKSTARQKMRVHERAATGWSAACQYHRYQQWHKWLQHNDLTNTTTSDQRN
jgi:hypothetical protein